MSQPIEKWDCIYSCPLCGRRGAQLIPSILIMAYDYECDACDIVWSVWPWGTKEALDLIEGFDKQ